jgi:tetratricopeptide (TPR) repeat protein/tRNA A-37 threonylcarbamoyl transferase component Bud32
MPRLQCRQGHQWDFDEARTLSLSEETCPTCGAAATIMNQTTDAGSKKDDGTINLDTGKPTPASEREESTITVNEAAKQQDAAAAAAPEATIDAISGQPAAAAMQEDTTLNVAPVSTAAARPDTTIDLKSGQPAKSADQEDRTVNYSGEKATQAGVGDHTGAWTDSMADQTSALAEGSPRSSGTWAEEAGQTSAFIEQAAQDLKAGRVSPTPARKKEPIKPGQKTVAGYEILGELGRGGMGVVYKARHLKLNRLVALKMVLSGAHASAEQLIRFKIEAEAVAKLQHPNIVAVYETGEEEGCPFFALEYIDGDSLVKKIDSTPQVPLEAARLMQSLAGAMQAAHERGVAHRDLKPANILLTKDGIPKITDFGLAKLADKDEGHTRTGAIMGTPSYMAPEQAQGRTKEAGPSADVYSLGAMFYDMLTGRPPFRGATLLDTLQQVQKMDPVAPARLQPGVPRDVETICLKALEKEPVKRYPTAGAMAEDLRRFIAGEPILARPAPWHERTVKWVKRRPALATAVGVSALAVISIVTFGFLWLDSERRAAEDREEQQAELAQTADKLAKEARQREIQEALGKKAAEKAAKEAKERATAEEKRAIAEEQGRKAAEDLAKEKTLAAIAAKKNADEQTRLRKEADQQRVRAERNFARAKEAVDEMLTRIGQDRLAHIPQMEKVRRDLLQKALVFYDQFRAEGGNDPASRWDVGRAYQRVADIQRMLGKIVDAEEANQNAMLILGQLAKEDKKNERYLADLAVSAGNLADIFRDTKRNQKAIDLLRDVVKFRIDLAAVNPDPSYRFELGKSRLNLAVMLGNSKEAEEEFAGSQLIFRELAKKADDPLRPQYQQELARSLSIQSNVLKSKLQDKEAEKALDEARSILVGLTKADRDNPDVMQDLGRVYHQLGDLYRDTQPKKAEPFYKDAVALRSDLVRNFTSVPVYRKDLASSHSALAILYQATDRLPLADQAYDTALQIQEQITKDFPNLPEYRLNLGASYNNRAIQYLQTKRIKECEEGFRKAEAQFDYLVKKYPGVREYEIELAGAYLNQASVLHSLNRVDEAIALNKKALRIHENLPVNPGTESQRMLDIGQIALNLGTQLATVGKFDDADAYCVRAVKEFTALLTKQENNPDYRVQLGASRYTRGRIMLVQKKYKLAREEFAKAIPHQAKLHADFADRLDYRLALASTYQDLAVAEGSESLLEPAEKSFRKSIELLEEVEGKVKADVAFFNLLIDNHKNLANLMAALKRPAQEEKSWLRILEVQGKRSKSFPKVLAYHHDLAGTENNVAAKLIQNDKAAQARPILLKAVAHLNEATALDVKNTQTRQLLYFSHLNLAAAEVGLGLHQDAAKTVAASSKFTSGDQPAYQVASAGFMARCVSLAEKDKALPADKGKALAKSYGDQAIGMLKQAVDKGYKDVKNLKASDDFEAIRSWPEFQQIVRTLEKTPPPPDKQ